MRARRLSAIVLAGALAVAATAIALRPVVVTDAGLPGSDGSNLASPLSDLGSRQPRRPRRTSDWKKAVRGGAPRSQARARARDRDSRPLPAPPTVGRLRAGLANRRERLSARLRSGQFDLGVVASSRAHGAAVLRRRPPANPDTRFVFLDYCCAKGAEALEGAPNATALTFTRRPGRPSRRLPEAAPPPGGSANAAPGRSTPCLDHQRRAGLPTTAGHWFKVSKPGRGAPFRAWRSSATTHLEYDNQATCERIANRQIDAGGAVVFAAAGDCALGALSAAALRGVWGVASSEDR